MWIEDRQFGPEVFWRVWDTKEGLWWGFQLTLEHHHYGPPGNQASIWCGEMTRVQKRRSGYGDKYWTYTDSDLLWGFRRYYSCQEEAGRVWEQLHDAPAAHIVQARL